jgi:hypothetical protein
MIMWLPYLFKRWTTAAAFGGLLNLRERTPGFYVESHDFNYDARGAEVLVFILDLRFNAGGGHSNVLVVDQKSCTMELFEPQFSEFSLTEQMATIARCETYLRSQGFTKCRIYEHLPLALVCPRLGHEDWQKGVLRVCEYLSYSYIILRIFCNLRPKRLLTFFGNLSNYASAFMMNKLHCYLLKLMKELKLNEILDLVASCKTKMTSQEFEIMSETLDQHFFRGEPEKARVMLENTQKILK